MLFGDDFLVWIVLAIGAAMVVGNLLALLRRDYHRDNHGDNHRTDDHDNKQTREGDLKRAPLGRSIVFILVGLVSAIWAVASLVSG